MPRSLIRLAMFGVLLALATGLPAQVPVPQPRWSVQITPQTPIPGQTATAVVDVTLPPGYYQDANSSFLGLEVDLEWPAHQSINVGQAVYSVPTTRNGHPSFQKTFTIRQAFAIPHDRPLPASLTVRFSYQICQIDGVCLLPKTVSQVISLTAVPILSQATTPLPVPTAPPTKVNWLTWLVALGSAFLGGVLLNFMPCVFPVLSLKALAIARTAGEDQRQRRTSSMRFATGEIVSLVALGFVVAGIKLSGGTPVWGGMFQYPGFVIALIGVFWIFALNLWDIGPRFSPSFSSAPSSDFWSGALKVIAAAPCTAPFLGPALGFAFALPPSGIVLFFAVVALGLALPDLLLAGFPGIFKILPKPGAWTHTFEKFMGLLLAGTALYLAYVFWQLAGTSSFWWLVMVLWATTGILALGYPWVAKKPRWVQGVFYVVLAGGLLIAGWLVSSSTTQSSPMTGSTTVAPTTGLPAGWVAFDQAKLDQARSSRPVFVDATAAWCATCLVNEAGVLSSSQVKTFLTSSGILLMRADFTRPSPAIAHWIESVNRAGLPVYALYLPGHERPIMFPELLEKQAFLNQLRQALAKHSGS